MPDLLTPQALATAGPLLIETLFKHFLSHATLTRKSEARGEDLMYDEAFVLMKTFLEMATKYPVAALQRFGLVRTPAPPWVALHRVIIPQKSLTQSAEFLIKAFGGEEMAYKVAGGSKWWQVRAGAGVEAEWIVMKKDWREHTKKQQSGSSGKEKGKGKEKEKEKEKVGVEEHMDAEGTVGEDGGVDEKGEFRKEMDELRCMLYIHGGAYYWGSINTHRYTIWRYARKMHGRCFAVNYRKAPQYPFPCAIHDCLAAWLYLVNPPPEAKHRPVHPSNIVIAGDSAGGGLVLALLQILRDTPGLELPAGAVLISPWSDLTHSFPSILKNTATDIVPPYSFIHKPSSLWPPPPPQLTDEMQSRLRSRVKEAVARIRDARHPERLQDLGKENPPEFSSEHLVSHPTELPENIRSSSPNNEARTTRATDEDGLHPISTNLDSESHPEPQGEPSSNPSRANPAGLWDSLIPRGTSDNIRPTTLAQCDTPIYLTVEEQKVALDTQIQLIATNAQLCHPWLSPILGYMGGLPPLLIVAGDNEVLRDEIIYIAHKAANPEQYPIREDVKKLLPSLEGIEERYGPTDVHLQVYDGTGHDLPLFSMTKPARGLFRAIASFARFCTPSAPGSLHVSKSGEWTSGFSSRDPSRPNSRPGSRPLSRRNSSYMSNTSSHQDQGPVILGDVTPTRTHLTTPPHSMPDLASLTISKDRDNSVTDGPPIVASPTPLSPETAKKRHDSKVTFSETPSEASDSIHHNHNSHEHRRSSTVPPPLGGEGSGQREDSREVSGDDAGPRFDGEDPDMNDTRALPGTAGHPGIYRGPELTLQPFKDHMIRERVAIDGTCRSLEPPELLDAMTMPTDEIGFIKEGPAMRYLNGQALWDKKYSRSRKQVAKKREKNLKDAKNKDSKKIVKLWQDKVKAHKENWEREHLHPHSHHLHPRRGSAGASASGTATPGDSSAVESESERDDTSPLDEDEGSGSELEVDREGEKTSYPDGILVDQSWSWSWALDGEAPPPSAIVSRRDFSEARRHALMADRMDDHSHHTPINGLSIWVALASFFSNTGERHKAQEAIKMAHEAQKAQKTKEKHDRMEELANEDRPGPFRKMSNIFKFGKKDSDRSPAHATGSKEETES